MVLQLVVMTMSVLWIGSHCQAPKPGTDQVAKHLRELMVGRCWNYQQYRELESRNLNCEELYKDFRASFEGKDPCAVRIEDYENFLMKAFHPNLSSKKLMFWAGVGAFVEEYAYMGKRYLTIANTLPGFMASKFRWCGSKLGGISSDTCPRWGICPNGVADHVFWRATSKEFAKRATGTVYVMLNGSRPNNVEAFENRSILNQYELPYWNNGTGTNVVKKVVVFVVHEIGKTVSERCHEKSIQTFEDRVVARNFDYQCLDDPASIRYFMCTDFPEAPECENIVNSCPGYRFSSLVWALVQLVLCVVHNF